MENEEVENNKDAISYRGNNITCSRLLNKLILFEINIQLSQYISPNTQNVTSPLFESFISFSFWNISFFKNASSTLEKMFVGSIKVRFY